MHAFYKSMTNAALAASMTLPAGCAVGARAARVETPAPPPPAVARTIEVEIRDAPPGGAARTVAYSLAVVDDNGWARLESRAVTGRLNLQARSDRVRGGPAIVRLVVERNEANGPDLSVSQSVIFYAGRRTVLGHLARSDGGTTEIAMTTR